MDNNNSRTGQWLQPYESHQIQEEETTPCFNAINMMSSSGSFLGDGGEAVHEAAGRQASKRAIPTTFLNANPSNFRALVQKFTGAGESNRRKGPVTLDFGSPNITSKEAIFPASSYRSNYDHDLAHNPHVSNEQLRVTWSSTEATTSYQLDDESHSVFDQDHHDYDLLREYSGSGSYDDVLDHMDYCYHDFHQHTAMLEEFMMNDIDL